MKIKYRIGDLPEWHDAPVSQADRLYPYDAVCVVSVHCCDSCARNAGVVPKSPADSGVESWPCRVCGHYGIGSKTDCTIGDWLILHPLTPNAKVSGAGTASAGLPLTEIEEEA